MARIVRTWLAPAILTLNPILGYWLLWATFGCRFWIPWGTFGDGCTLYGGGGGSWCCNVFPWFGFWFWFAFGLWRAGNLHQSLDIHNPLLRNR